MSADVSELRAMVSVIALCYNHERFVIECLESIRSQTFTDYELIIMDDFSQDASCERIRDWISANGVQCRFIAHTSNMGICKTLNEAVSLCHGRYVSMIATDDAWLPEKLAVQVNIMEKLPEDIGVLYSDAYQMDEQGVRLQELFIPAHRHFDAVPQGNVYESIVRGNYIPAMTTFIRRSVYQRIGGYDERLVYEDWDFWLRAALQFKFAYFEMPSANYRVVATSMARTVLQARNPAMFYTHFLISDKILRAGPLSGHLRDLTVQRLVTAAREMYTLAHQRAAPALFRAFIVTWRPSHLYFALLCLVGISHARYWHIVNYLRWRFSRHNNESTSNTKGRE